MTITLDIAEKFTPTPIGRFRADGKRSGEVFREDILRPELADAAQKGEQLVIDFSGMVGVNPSFLEEAFGGLVRVPDPKHGKTLSADEIFRLVKFYSDKPYFNPYIKKIEGYIRAADKEKSKGRGR